MPVYFEMRSKMISETDIRLMKMNEFRIPALKHRVPDIWLSLYWLKDWHLGVCMFDGMSLQIRSANDYAIFTLERISSRAAISWFIVPLIFFLLYFLFCLHSRISITLLTYELITFRWIFLVFHKTIGYLVDTATLILFHNSSNKNKKIIRSSSVDQIWNVHLSSNTYATKKMYDSSTLKQLVKIL